MRFSNSVIRFLSFASIATNGHAAVAAEEGEFWLIKINTPKVIIILCTFALWLCRKTNKTKSLTHLNKLWFELQI